MRRRVIRISNPWWFRGVAPIKKPKCNHCGQCCGKCPYLIRYINGKTNCSIYPLRIGAITVPGEICVYRETVKRDYPGCPYNTGP